MTSIHDDAATRGQALASRPLDVAEALCFARDLGGSMSHVVVAAAGRALAVSAGYDTEIEITMVSRDGLGVSAVPGARDAPLPQVRAEVDAALAGSCPSWHEALEGRIGLVVVESDASATAAHAVLRDDRLVLETSPCGGDPLTLSLTLWVGHRSIDVEQAEELLGQIVRLLERPYRRLV